MRGMNCLGKFSRNSGYMRVPDPPHMITGRSSDRTLSSILQFFKISIFNVSRTVAAARVVVSSSSKHSAARSASRRAISGIAEIVRRAFEAGRPAEAMRTLSRPPPVSAAVADNQDLLGAKSQINSIS